MHPIMTPITRMHITMPHKRRLSRRCPTTPRPFSARLSPLHACTQKGSLFVHLCKWRQAAPVLG